MSGLLILIVVALCGLNSLEMGLVSSEERMDLPEVARVTSSCPFVIRISMTMPFANIVVVKRLVIDLFFIVIGPQPTASSLQWKDILQSEKYHPVKRSCSACCVVSALNNVDEHPQ